MKSPIGISIKEANDQYDLEKVWRLTHDVYVEEGYAEPQPDHILRHYPHLDMLPETTVLIAVDIDDKLLGTNSYTIDNPNGLHVDEDFPKEMAKLRKECKEKDQILIGSWRVVVHPDYRTSPVAMKLFERTMLDTWVLGDVLVCDFNPKHEKFYAKLFGFKTISENICRSVRSHPAVLMSAETNYIVEHYKKRRKGK